MLRFVLCFILITLALNNKISFAQCFASPGNPIAGSSNLGVLDEGIIRAVGFYQYNLLDNYYEGSNRIKWDKPSAISSAYYNYGGFSIGYGITQKFTVETEIGYFFNKTQNYKYIDEDLAAGGLSNAIISGKYNIYRDYGNNIELSLSAGAKIPLSLEPKRVDGVEVPIDVQPSTGNFGAVFQSFFVKEFDAISARLILINRYENNLTENKMGYKFGDEYVNSLFFSKHLANPYTDITKNITLILQARHEYRKKNYKNGEIINYSGNNLFFLSPQLNYNYNMIWNFSIMYDIPVYQYYEGVQLGNSYSLTFSLTRDIGFNL